MKHAFKTLTMAAISAALLSACAGSSDKYPSLSIRDAERQTGQFTPVDPSVPTPAQTGSAETFSQLRGYVEEARAAHQQFTAEQPDAERLAGSLRGLGAEDDRRARALLAVAALTSLHGQTTLALSDLDNLEFIAASALDPVDDIKAAQTLVGQMIAEQDAVLDSLSARIAE